MHVFRIIVCFLRYNYDRDKNQIPRKTISRHLQIIKPALVWRGNKNKMGDSQGTTLYNNLINGMLKREKHFPSCFPPLLILFTKTYTICYGCYGWCRSPNMLCMLDLHMCLECLMDTKLRSTELICFLNSSLSVSWPLKLRSTELIWSLSQKIRIMITLSSFKHSAIMIVWLSSCQKCVSASFRPMF